MAVCDNDLLGTTLDEGGINFKIDGSFYGTTSVGISEILEVIEECTLINAVGNNIIDLLVDEGFIERTMVTEIEGIGHAQMVKV